MSNKAREAELEAIEAHNTAALLPCPFCGELPTITKHFKHDMHNLLHRCPVVGPIKLDWSYPESLATRWNTRTGGE